MEVFDLLQPLLSANIRHHELPGDSLGQTIVKNMDEAPWTELPEEIKIAIIAVPEYRGAKQHEGAETGVDIIRKHLYQLKNADYKFKIADLGNLKTGESLADTYAALNLVLSELLLQQIIPVIIGGSQDLTFPQYTAYKNLEQTVNVVAIDRCFDVGTPEDEVSAQSYMGKIILHKPNYLFNYSNIGYQSYFESAKSVELMQKLFFDVHRLGNIRANLELAEPVVRNADMLSIDLSAVKSCDAPGCTQSSVHGFYGEELCQIVRYAGMSDKLSSVGFYEYNETLDNKEISAQLIAQAIWYFLEGVAARKNDYPNRIDGNYLRYTVNASDGAHELIFFKSIKSGRWWMEVPYGASGQKNKRHQLVPCAEEDYKIANTNELPERWWQTFQKLN